MVSEIAAKTSIPLRLTEIRAIDAEIDRAAGPGHPASSLNPGTVSRQNLAVVGEQGYLFIDGASNRWESQYLGQVAAVPQWVAHWCKVFETRQAKARERGIELWNFIAPEKQVVLPHLRWSDRKEDGGKRPLKVLQRSLSAGARLVYPEYELRAATENGPVYYRHNSHWSPSGCSVGMQVLLDHMETGIDLDALDLKVRVDRGSHDLTRHLFINPPEEEILAFSPNGELTFDNQHHQKTGTHTGSIYTLSNPGAPDPRKLMIFGDSYSYDAGIAFVLSAVFKDVFFIWAKSVSWELIDNQRPDVVLWESAERFIVVPSTE